MEFKRVSSEIENLESSIRTLHSESSTLNKKINELNLDLTNLQNKNKQKKSEISLIIQQNLDLKDQIPQKLAQIEQLNKTYEDLYRESKFLVITATKEQEEAKRLENLVKVRDESQNIKEKSFEKYMSLMKNNENMTFKPKSRSPSKYSDSSSVTPALKLNQDDYLQDQEVRRLEMEISELENIKNDQLRYETKRLKDRNFKLRAVSHKSSIPSSHLLLSSLIGMIFAVVLKALLNNL
jgi:hypothetical protein